MVDLFWTWTSCTIKTNINRKVRTAKTPLLCTFFIVIVVGSGYWVIGQYLQTYRPIVQTNRSFAVVWRRLSGSSVISLTWNKQSSCQAKQSLSRKKPSKYIVDHLKFHRTSNSSCRRMEKVTKYNQLTDFWVIYRLVVFVHARRLHCINPMVLSLKAL